MLNFEVVTVQGFVIAPRYTESGSDLHDVDTSSKFVKAFTKKYKLHGVVQMSVSSFTKDHVQISMTLASVWNNKTMTMSEYFSKDNIGEFIQNFYKEFSN